MPSMAKDMIVGSHCVMDAVMSSVAQRAIGVIEKTEKAKIPSSSNTANVFLFTSNHSYLTICETII